MAPMAEKKVVELAPWYKPKKPTLFRGRPGDPVGPGKGSAPRPYTDREHYDKEFERIFGKKEPNGRVPTEDS